MASATAKPSPHVDALRLASRDFDAGRLERAKQRCEAVLARSEGDPDALHLLGLIAYRHEQHPLALRLISEALTRRQHFPQALANLGAVLVAMREWSTAIETLEAALRQDPDQPGVLSNLGTAHLEQGDLDAAELWFRKVLKRAPDRAIAWNNLGNVHRLRHAWRRAERCLRRAVRLDASYADPHKNLGSVLLAQGHLAEAEAAFRKALSLASGDVEALTGLAQTKRFSPEDADLQLFPRAAGDVKRWTDERRALFFFSWGKALDDAKCYSDAFRCFAEGNAVRARQRPYPEGSYTRLVDELTAAFPRERIADLQAHGSRDESPVFILGMPRSGTTLTERVLASHPQVLAGGELPAMTRAITDDSERPLQNFYPEWLAGLDGEALAAVVHRYLSARPDPAAHHARVTDKMPGNTLHIGLIRLAFPRARILHCVRDPLDVCLSCYQKDFSEGQNFSFSLERLAERFRDYIRLMEFWRSVFPDGWLDVPYQAVTADPEQWSRRIIDYVGLPWDDACLSPHRSGGLVLTASAWQVRQPVYRSSNERWRRYEAELAPLRDALAPYVDWHRRFPRLDEAVSGRPTSDA
ncbi:tetratricopeptide repeat-containing sulfotransferase family protein [Spiribacter halobius]|uniref:Uncharacterized protein n=1 Tax=Sediminicurvatus halobius TaxID=2182432 RepID=A0A2U2MZT5_9GAMM|nr:sulfotransferase [Spiribacter halobius]PWG62303.1 hypothetical protein DEM34_12570 [Spiribacter halobius]UEX79776.1 sulfotransferase [Spiribacter halobius]